MRIAVVAPSCRLTEEAAEAVQAIAAARGEAMSHVRTIGAGAAQAMVERLTGATPSQAELDAALGAEA